MYNSIPKKPRFNCAEEKARQVLLYYKVNTLPIDVRKLIKASNIFVQSIYYSQIKIPPAQGGRRRGEFRIIDFESEE